MCLKKFDFCCLNAVSSQVHTIGTGGRLWMEKKNIYIYIYIYKIKIKKKKNIRQKLEWIHKSLLAYSRFQYFG